MTAAWSERVPDRSRADRAAVVQLGLALVGAGLVFGSLVGAAYGAVRVAIEALHDGGDD